LTHIADVLKIIRKWEWQVEKDPEPPAPEVVSRALVAPEEQQGLEQIKNEEISQVFTKMRSLDRRLTARENEQRVLPMLSARKETGNGATPRLQLQPVESGNGTAPRTRELPVILPAAGPDGKCNVTGCMDFLHGFHTQVAAATVEATREEEVRDRKQEAREKWKRLDHESTLKFKEFKGAGEKVEQLNRAVRRFSYGVRDGVMSLHQRYMQQPQAAELSPTLSAVDAMAIAGDASPVPPQQAGATSAPQAARDERPYLLRATRGMKIRVTSDLCKLQEEVHKAELLWLDDQGLCPWKNKLGLCGSIVEEDDGTVLVDNDSLGWVPLGACTRDE